MKPCESVQGKLVSGEPLASQQLAHLERCEDCRGVQASIESIARATETIRTLSQPPSGEIRAVQETVARRTRPAGWRFRLAWAGTAMVLGMLLALAVLTNTFATDDLRQSEERLIALLDEVSQIADPDEENPMAIGELEGIYLAEALLEENTRVDTELDLPESYELLEQALQNDWL